MSAPQPQFAIGDKVETVANGKRFIGAVQERQFWDSDWWYSIDRRNYLHENTWTRVAPEGQS